jgi:para-nitrobenzyl esterase
MFRLTLAALGAALLLALAPVAASQTAKTKSGDVSGVSAGNAVSFKGIPFAAPPIGDLRWKPPQPAASWTGVRKAETYGAACPQPNRDDGGGGGRADVQNEDCLTLNVWAPAAAKDLPVMVWIHGGAHRLGSGSFPIYDGSELAKQGVVLVTINYRLGLLGYFAHPALTAAAAPNEPLGNYGLMDQIAALQWVQDNIAGFGGDPKNVTVFGESAGGASTVYLLTQPKAKGLFAKAIVESGGGLQRPVALKDNEQRGVASAANIGLGPSATLAEMKAKTAQDWITAQGALQGGLGFGPFIDGRLVTEAPWQAFRDGRAIDVPLIIGANSNEASVLATLGVPTTALAAAAGQRLAEFRKLYGEATPEAEFSRQAMGDVVFVAPSRWVAGAAAPGAPSWLYYFSYVASARRSAVPGAAHGSEIPYIFKSWTNMPVLARMVSAEDRKVSDVMSSCWVAFARTGKPSCSGAPDWPAYDPKTDQQMEFGAAIKVGKPPRAAAFDLLLEQFLATAR